MAVLTIADRQRCLHRIICPGALAYCGYYMGKDRGKYLFTKIPHCSAEECPLEKHDEEDDNNE